MDSLNHDSEFMDPYEKHLAQMEKRERIADILSIISPIGKILMLGSIAVSIVVSLVTQELIESEKILSIIGIATNVLWFVLRELDRLTTVMAIVSLALGTKKKVYAIITLAMQGAVIMTGMILVLAFILFWVIVLLTGG